MDALHFTLSAALVQICSMAQQQSASGSKPPKAAPVAAMAVPDNVVWSAPACSAHRPLGQHAMPCYYSYMTRARVISDSSIGSLHFAKVPPLPLGMQTISVQSIAHPELHFFQQRRGAGSRP